jgi:hypothetical protein
MSTGAEPDRRTDRRAGHLDDGLQRSRRGRRIGRVWAVTTGDPTPGPDAAPHQRHRRVDQDAVDRHAGCGVEADDPRQLAHRRRVRVRPQFVGGTPGSGHDEARWSIEVHTDLWVEWARRRKRETLRAVHAAAMCVTRTCETHRGAVRVL